MAELRLNESQDDDHSHYSNEKWFMMRRVEFKVHVRLNSLFIYNRAMIFPFIWPRVHRYMN